MALSKKFSEMLRELSTKSVDTVSIYRSAKTPLEKAAVRKTIVTIARDKALLRDEIAGFLRHMSFIDIRRVHRLVMELHTDRVIMSLATRKPQKRSAK